MTQRLKETPHEGWTTGPCLAILQALCLISLAACSANSETGRSPEALILELKEACLAREAAQQRLAETSASLREKEKQLELLRRRYADLYVEARSQQEELEYLELRVSGLLTDRDDVASGRELSRVLRALEDMRDRQETVSGKLREFRIYLDSCFEVLQPTADIRREVAEHVASLEKAAALPVRPLSLVAGRGSGDLDRLECRVLAVEDDLQVVVLDRGSVEGIRLGTDWQYVHQGKVRAGLRVVEVRAFISAAIVTDGKVAAVGPGALLVPAE